MPRRLPERGVLARLAAHRLQRPQWSLAAPKGPTSRPLKHAVQLTRSPWPLGPFIARRSGRDRIVPEEFDIRAGRYRQPFASAFDGRAAGYRRRRQTD